MTSPSDTNRLTPPTKDVESDSLCVWSQPLGPGVFLLGILVLAGWAFDISTLKSMLPGWVSMKATKAAALHWCLV